MPDLESPLTRNCSCHARANLVDFHLMCLPLSDYNGVSAKCLYPANPSTLVTDWTFRVNPRQCKRLSFEKLETRRLLVLTPHLELDIKAERALLGAYQVGEVEAVGDLLFFKQLHPNYGQELWRLGPTGDPQLVKDILPGEKGSDISQTTSVGDKLLFIAKDDRSLYIDEVKSLWVSDGTEAGTLPLVDGIIGPVSFAAKEFQNHKFFMRYEKAGVELWKTDGTVAGTKMVYYIDRYDGGRDTQWAQYNGQLYFTFADELWKTDGTAAGTINDLDGLQSTAPKLDYRGGLVATSFGLFYRTSAGVWYSDGLSDSPTFLTPREATGYSTSFEGVQTFFELNGKVYFGFGGVYGPSRLWRSDGTAAGTGMAIDLETLPAREMRLAVQLGNSIVFAGTNKIWRYDGSSVTELGNPGYDAEYFRADGSVAYFGFYNNKLWRTDGTAPGTIQVANISVRTPLDEVGYDWAMTNGTLYFYGFASGQGFEIFAHRGDQVEPVNVSRMFDRQKTPANYSNFAVANNKAFFFGQSKYGDADSLFVFDSASNKLISIQKDWPKEYFASGVIAYRENVYFPKKDGMWRTDGTEAGTSLFAPGLSGFTVVGDLLFWQAGSQYFISDGTTQGTRPVNLSLNGSALPFSLLTNFPVYSSGTYWMHYKVGDGSNNRILKTVDWVNFEEVRFEGITGFVDTYGLTPTPIGLFIHTGGSNEGIWFASQTTARFLINPKTPLSSFGGAIFYNNRLFFVGFTNENGQEPWYSDGTVVGTRMLLDINRGPQYSGAALDTGGGFNFQKLGSQLLFQSTTQSGSEWWISNGTASGTHIVDDIVPGRGSPFISNPIVHGDRAYFVACDHFFGEELWITDGTATGTYPLTDLMPGSGGAIIQNITVVGDDLLFLGSDMASGKSVWSLNRAHTRVHPLTQELLVYENVPAGSPVGKVERETLNLSPQFAIKSGNEAGYFEVAAATGQIVIAKVGLDFEGRAEHLLMVSQGPGFPDVSVRVKVLDLNEPPVLPTSVVVTVRNDVPLGKIVGSIPFDNPEKTDRIRFEFPSFTQSFGFLVDTFSGEIFVLSRSNFDTLRAVSFDVRITDLGVSYASYITKVIINFTDFNDPPVLVRPLSAVSLTEGVQLVFPFESSKFVDPELQSLNFEMSINNKPLPSWIAYDAASQSFTATPPVGTDSVLGVLIVATDAVGEKISTRFGLYTKPFYRWHNYTTPLDTSRNGSVSPVDALLVINYLNSGKTRDVKNGSADQADFIDVNADNIISPIDALLVINFLNSRADGEGEGEVENTHVLDWDLQLGNTFDWLQYDKKRFADLRSREGTSSHA